MSRRFVSTGRALRQSIQISEKPHFTGAGPFIELPNFASIGSSANLLNITIPASSYLNIKSGALVAIDGDLNGLSSYQQKLLTFVTYNKLVAQNPVSIIINGKSHYSVIDVAKADNWKILSSNSLIAWSGFTLDLLPAPLFGNSHSFKTTGSGKLILQGENQLFEVEIEKNEEITINPLSLVATNSDSINPTALNNSRINWERLNFFKGSKVIEYITHAKSYVEEKVTPAKSAAVELDVPKGIPSPQESSLASVKTQSQEVTTKALLKISPMEGSLDKVIAKDPLTNKDSISITKEIKKVWDWISLNLLHRFSTRPIYINVKGPCKILIDNTYARNNRSFFTKYEIHNIFRGNK